MATKRGISDLIKEEAGKAAVTAADPNEGSATPVEVVNNESSDSTAAELAAKDQAIAKLEQSLTKTKTDLEAAQKEVLRLLDENKQLKAKPGAAPKAKPPTSGQMVVASGIEIAYAHKSGDVLIPDLVVNQDAENNKDFAANAWML